MPQLQPPPAAQVQQFLHSAQLQAPQREHLHRSLDHALAGFDAGAAGWHGADDIRTLEGLGGHFLWPEDPLRPARMSLRFTPGQAGHQGSYELGAGLELPEEGPFWCVPNNPAIGWAGLTLQPGGGRGVQRTFVVAGMMTDAAWKISILLLNRLGPQGPLQPAFAAVRML